MVQFMCNVIHGVKVFGIKKILCRRYLISVIYVNKKSLTIKIYILVGCYFCTYFFHLLNFDINKVVSFDINLFIYWWQYTTYWADKVVARVTFIYHYQPLFLYRNLTTSKIVESVFCVCDFFVFDCVCCSADQIRRRMAGHQCCSNPPTLDPSAGAGHVEQLCGLSTYVTGSPNAKHAIILISDIFGTYTFLWHLPSLLTFFSEATIFTTVGFLLVLVWIHYIHHFIIYY